MDQFPSTRGYRRDQPARSKTKDGPLPPHKFSKNEELATDWRGLHFCLDCRKPGVEGDQRHPKGAKPLAEVLNPPQRLPPTPEAARELDARILGGNA